MHRPARRSGRSEPELSIESEASGGPDRQPLGDESLGEGCPVAANGGFEQRAFEDVALGVGSTEVVEHAPGRPQLGDGVGVTAVVERQQRT